MVEEVESSLHASALNPGRARALEASAVAPSVLLADWFRSPLLSYTHRPGLGLVPLGALAKLVLGWKGTEPRV